MKGNVTVAHNTARNGGGAYLTESELNCQNKNTLIFFNNSAAHKGGGVHAIYQDYITEVQSHLVKMILLHHYSLLIYHCRKRRWTLFGSQCKTLYRQVPR